jgi:Non-classical export protein 1
LLDPALGVFTGVLAFYLRQTNPKTALPPEETLSALVSWKVLAWKEERRRKMVEQEEKAMRELAK